MTAQPLPRPEMVDEVLRRTIEICTVPGPPRREHARGDLVEGWWRSDALTEVTRDRIGNVWAQVRRGDPRRPAIVVCAHLDTVFEPAEHRAHSWVGNRLYAPSVGDDSVALAALSSLRDTLPQHTTAPVWVLATVGEEGLGDLAGVRAALAAPEVPVGALIAVEGNYLGRICTVGVGSARWRVTVRGPGGHAWEAAINPSAVHDAAAIVRRLAELLPPDGARASINVGTFSGGEAINSRARTAVFEVDVRAADPSVLATLVDACETILDATGRECAVTRERIGDRPAGEIALAHALVRSAAAAHRTVGIEPRFTAASTDANAAHAAGIPAIAVGVTHGEGEHTLDEWIDASLLSDGLAALAATVQGYDEETGCS